MNEQHEMNLEKTHPSGAEEWSCPICGRRFVVQWPPAFHIFVLEPGDQNAKHCGSTGPIRISPLQTTQNEDAGYNEELSLGPWLKWLDQVEFENWWKNDT